MTIYNYGINIIGERVVLHGDVITLDAFKNRKIRAENIKRIMINVLSYIKSRKLKIVRRTNYGLERGAVGGAGEVWIFSIKYMCVEAIRCQSIT